MKIYLLSLIGIGLMASTSAFAQTTGTRESLEAEAAKVGNGNKTEYADYTLIVTPDKLIRYYITKPNSSAYPYDLKVVVTPLSPPPYNIGDKVKVVANSFAPSSPPLNLGNSPFMAMMRWATALTVRTEREYNNKASSQ